MKKTKAYLNILKLKVNMRLKREVVRNYPVVAFIEPNLFCNLQCPACPTGLRLNLRPSVSISEELFRAAIDEMGDYLFQLVMYNWGEPLLHKQTPEMIRYASDKGIKVSLSTNLSIRLTDDYIERLVKSGLDTMIISLDGITEDVYKYYRRNGNLNLVRENLLRIRNAKERLGVQTPKLVWQFLVFKHNEHQIEQARQLLREWGADELNVAPAIMPVEPYNDGFEPSTIPQYNMYLPDHPQRKEARRQMKSDKACSWLYGVFVLNPNGKVSACCAVPSDKFDFGEYSAGDKVLDVWNNETFKRARRLFVRARPGKTKPGKAKTAAISASVRKEKPSSLVNITRQGTNMKLDGMAMRATMELTEDKIICHKCPIPHMQNYVDPVLTDVAGNLVATFHESGSVGGKARSLLNYLLMGAPQWRELGVARLGDRVLSYNDWFFYLANPRNWSAIGQKNARRVRRYFHSQ